jgi:hypothetical protein
MLHLLYLLLYNPVRHTDLTQIPVIKHASNLNGLFKETLSLRGYWLQVPGFRCCDGFVSPESFLVIGKIKIGLKFDLSLFGPDLLKAAVTCASKNMDNGQFQI